MGNLFYEQLQRDCEEDDNIYFPSLKWNRFNNYIEGINDEKLKTWLYLFSREYPEGNNYILYGKQKYNHEHKYTYFTVLVEVKESSTSYDCDVVYDWDFDEGQQCRLWIGYADLMEFEEAAGERN